MKKRNLIMVLFAIICFSSYAKNEISKKGRPDNFKVIYKNISTGKEIEGCKFILESLQNDVIGPKVEAIIYDASLQYNLSSIFSEKNTIEDIIHPCAPSGYIVNDISKRYSDILALPKLSTGRELIFYCSDYRNEEKNLHYYDPRAWLSVDGGIFELSNGDSFDISKRELRQKYYCSTPAILNESIRDSYLYGKDFVTPFGYEKNHEVISIGEDEREYIEVILEPKEIPLHFYTEIPSTLTTDDVQGDYTGVRIGEYLWVTSNFNHKIPRRYIAWYDQITFPHWIYGSIIFGHETMSPVTQETLNRYMPCHEMDPSAYQLDDINDFAKYYGSHYDYFGTEYMSGFGQNGTVRQGYGRMGEGKAKESKPWKLPSQSDFAQLFAMCDAGDDMCLGEQDVEYDLGARLGDNPLAFRIRSKGQVVGWFDGTKNKYGFNLMPGGGRISVNDTWWTNGLGESGGWLGAYGDLYHLFQAEYFHTMEEDGARLSITIHDKIEFHNISPSKWLNVRWCRKLTDEELGYKLYVNSTQTDIQKLTLQEPIPLGYSELQNGYLRGFYVQYILNSDRPKTVKEIVEIVKNTERVNESAPASISKKQNIKMTMDMERDEVRLNDNVYIYPNPANDNINISGEFIDIALYNQNGSLIIKSKDNYLNIKNLACGLYIAKINTLGGVVTQKVVKK